MIPTSPSEHAVVLLDSPPCTFPLIAAHTNRRTAGCSRNLPYSDRLIVAPARRRAESGRSRVTLRGLPRVVGTVTQRFLLDVEASLRARRGTQARSEDDRSRVPQPPPATESVRFVDAADFLRPPITEKDEDRLVFRRRAVVGVASTEEPDSSRDRDEARSTRPAMPSANGTPGARPAPSSPCPRRWSSSPPPLASPTTAPLQIRAGQGTSNVGPSAVSQRAGVRITAKNQQYLSSGDTRYRSTPSISTSRRRAPQFRSDCRPWPRLRTGRDEGQWRCGPVALRGLKMPGTHANGGIGASRLCKYVQSTHVYGSPSISTRVSYASTIRSPGTTISMSRGEASAGVAVKGLHLRQTLDDQHRYGPASQLRDCTESGYPHHQVADGCAHRGRSAPSRHEVSRAAGRQGSASHRAGVPVVGMRAITTQHSGAFMRRPACPYAASSHASWRTRPLDARVRYAVRLRPPARLRARQFDRPHGQWRVGA